MGLLLKCWAVRARVQGGRRKHLSLEGGHDASRALFPLEKGIFQNKKGTSLLVVRSFPLVITSLPVCYPQTPIISLRVRENNFHGPLLKTSIAVAYNFLKLQNYLIKNTRRFVNVKFHFSTKGFLSYRLHVFYKKLGSGHSTISFLFSHEIFSI